MVKQIRDVELDKKLYMLFSTQHYLSFLGRATLANATLR